MRILFLTSRVPYPIEKGDKLRTFNFLRELSKYHEIHLFALDEYNTAQDDINVLRNYCKSIKVFKISKFEIYRNVVTGFFKKLPLQVAYYTNNDGIASFREYYRDVAPDIVFCQLVRTSEYIKDDDINIPKIVDIQDTMSVNVARSAKKGNLPERPILMLEAARMKEYENKIFNSYDKKIIISANDRQLYPHKDRNEIFVVPNGVDRTFFQPDENVTKDIDILFLGNIGYRPNIDASLFLIKEILPRVKVEFPNVKVAIAGVNPPKKIVKLQDENVMVTGRVDDIRTYYNRSKIFLAPMRIGTGLQNKLLEAMSMKLPCITTPLANESLKGKSGKNILVGRDAQTLAQHVTSLLKDRHAADEIADNGYNFIIKNYDWQAIGQKLNEIITR